MMVVVRCESGWTSGELSLIVLRLCYSNSFSGCNCFKKINCT